MHDAELKAGLADQIPNAGMSLFEKLCYLEFSLPRWLTWRPSTQGDSQPQPLPAIDGLRANMYCDWPDSAGFAASVGRLLHAQNSATAFQTPEWQAALAWPYARMRRYRLVTILDGDELVGVLPLWIRSRSAVETVGAMVSDYLEPLVRRDCAISVCASFLRALRGLPDSGIRRLELRNVRKECIDLEALAVAAAHEGFDLIVEPAARVARVLLPATWDDYLASLSTHCRKEIRRKLRNAETKAGARLVIAEAASDVTAALDKTLEFMRRSGGNKNLKVRWIYRPMFERAAAGLARGGWLRVYLLRLHDRDAAGIVCFPSATGPMLWGAGFDEAIRGWSPGIVLFAMALRDAIEKRAACFDFMRGEGRYKAELGATDSLIYRVSLNARNS
jgi:CelD/BcsL family acetyltransferase involved in cellulose biosynthesis